MRGHVASTICVTYIYDNVIKVDLFRIALLYILSYLCYCGTVVQHHVTYYIIYCVRCIHVQTRAMCIDIRFTGQSQIHVRPHVQQRPKMRIFADMLTHMFFCIYACQHVTVDADVCVYIYIYPCIQVCTCIYACRFIHINLDTPIYSSVLRMEDSHGFLYVHQSEYICFCSSIIHIYIYINIIIQIYITI